MNVLELKLHLKLPFPSQVINLLKGIFKGISIHILNDDIYNNKCFLLRNLC